MTVDRSPLQERLTAAVDAVTPEVDVDAVVRRIDQARVEHRRATLRQRGVRRVIASGTLVAACMAGVVLVTSRPTRELHTVDAADPGPGTGVVTDGDTPSDGGREPDPRVGPTDLPGNGSRATLVATATDGFWVTRGEVLDGPRTGPDTVTWIGHDGSVGPSTEVRGVALSGVADEDHLWFLVREATDPTAPGALRLKQVDRSSGTLLASHDLPLGEWPVGVGRDGSNIRVHGATHDVLLDPTGAVVDDRAVATAPTPGRVLASGTELARLDPSDAVVSGDGDHLWILRGTTVRPLPRDR